VIHPGQAYMNDMPHGHHYMHCLSNFSIMPLIIFNNHLQSQSALFVMYPVDDLILAYMGLVLLHLPQIMV